MENKIRALLNHYANDSKLNRNSELSKALSYFNEQTTLALTANNKNASKETAGKGTYFKKMQSKSAHSLELEAQKQINDLARVSSKKNFLDLNERGSKSRVARENLYLNVYASVRSINKFSIVFLSEIRWIFVVSTIKYVRFSQIKVFLKLTFNNDVTSHLLKCIYSANYFRQKLFDE
jgi:hypothetical protein